MLEGLRRAFSGFSERLLSSSLSPKEASEILEDFKLQLVGNDVSLEAAERLCQEIESRLREARLPRLGDRRLVVSSILEEALSSVILEAAPDELIRRIREKVGGSPFVILFVGPNGGGKTTTVAKMAYLLKKRGIASVMACSDTFRAAAIEQMRSLAERVGVRVVSQKYGSDPAAVAVDAIKSASATRTPVVLIDTAGRTEVNRNLLEEMRKIKRVTSPDAVIYVGDSLTGNVALEQAKQFDAYVGVDYIILSKLDADSRGGSAVSICYGIKKPIILVGVGQGIEDLRPFDKALILERILRES